MRSELEQAFLGLLEKLLGWLEAIVYMLPNFVIAVLIVAASWFAARLASGAARRMLRRVSMNGEVNDLLARIVQVGLLLSGIFVALGILQLEKTVTSLLAGVGILGLAVGFACQDMAANLVSGIAISVRRPFRVGDVVETNEHFGTIERIELRAVDLRRPSGELVIIPNRKVFESAIVNFTDRRLRRVDLEVGVSYGEDLEQVKRVVLETVAGLERREPHREAEFYYTGFGESSIDFVARFWIRFTKQSDFLAARSEAILAIKRRFDQEGITIPFPIRTLDFSEVGGERLTDVLRVTGLAHAGNGQGV